jgi:hypothetical protein
MLFKNPLDPDNSAIRKAIKQWISEKMSLDTSITITITELNCCGETCPHIETIITVWTEKPEIIKVAKPLIYVRKHDITKA